MKLTGKQPNYSVAFQNPRRKVKPLPLRNLDCSHLAVSVTEGTDHPRNPSFHNQKHFKTKEHKITIRMS